VERHQAEAARYRAMLEAGTGIRLPESQPQIPPQIQRAREQFDAIYPGFSTFMAQAPLLMQVARALQEGGIDPRSFSRLPDVFAGVEYQWERHAQSTLEPIHSAIAQDYGLQQLTPRQARTVTQDFIAWVEENPQRAQRYTRGDRTLGAEYLEDYRSGFITPLRASAAAPVVTQAQRSAGLPPVPRPSGIAPPAPAAPPLTEDQIHDNAWQQFQAARAGA
jgi:hypothetical protein